MSSVSIGPLSPLAALDLPDLRWDCVSCQIQAQHRYHLSSEARGRAPALRAGRCLLRSRVWPDQRSLLLPTCLPVWRLRRRKQNPSVLPRCSLLGLGTMVRTCAAGRWHSSESRLGATASSAERAKVPSGVARTTILTAFVRALFRDTVK